MKTTSRAFTIVCGFLFSSLTLTHSSARAECLTDFHINQSWQTHGLSSEELHFAQQLALAGEPARGWKYLADLGDNYAALAANVVSESGSGTSAPLPIGDLFHQYVLRHWTNVVGPEKTALHFANFAKQHFRQYVEVLSSGTWPDADQILNSYLHSARTHGLPEMVVFDAAWTASDFSQVVSWQVLNLLPTGRTVSNSKICLNISNSEANAVIENDFFP